MGELHIYEVEGMEEYIPKKVYHGYAGRVQSFIDSMSSALFPKADSGYFNDIRRKNMLEIYNAARNIALCEKREKLVVDKMNWYVGKIVNLLTKGGCSYDGFCVHIEAKAWLKYGSVEVEVRDCDGEIFSEAYDFDFKWYISEPNYLKRDYSDKLRAYTCNLLELYGKYFGDRDLDVIRAGAVMNGDKAYSGRGFVEWS